MMRDHIVKSVDDLSGGVDDSVVLTNLYYRGG